MYLGELPLFLKGDRNYVHGTTIFDEVIKLLSKNSFNNINNIEFFINKVATTNLKLAVEPLNARNAFSPANVAIMRFTMKGQPMQACISTADGVPKIRLPYDESLIIDHCEIDFAGRGITIENNDSGFSQIEVLVSMNKALHLNTLKKPENTSWVFCRFDSPSWTPTDNPVDITITLQRLLGTRLTRANVELGGQFFGQIYFSAKASP